MTALSRRDTLLTLLVILIWGAHFQVIKAGVEQVGPLVSLALRFGITTLIFIPFMKWPGWPAFKKIAEIGILMGILHQGLLFVASDSLDSASTAVLVQSQTIFAVILGWLILGEGFKWRTSLGLLLGGAGLVVMLGVPDVADHPQAFAMVIVSAFVLALSYIRMRQLSHVNPMTFIAILNGVSFPLALAASFVMEGTDAWHHVPDADWHVLAFVLAYQSLLVAFSHILWQRLLARNEVARVTCFTLLTPVIAITIAVLFFGTALTWQLLLGAGLVVGGLGIVVIRRVQMKRNTVIVD